MPFPKKTTKPVTGPVIHLGRAGGMIWHPYHRMTRLFRSLAAVDGHPPGPRSGSRRAGTGRWVDEPAWSAPTQAESSMVEGRRRNLVFVTILLGMLLAALDQMIAANALPDYRQSRCAGSIPAGA